MAGSFPCAPLCIEEEQMSVTRERFAQGISYDAFRAQMTRNQERFDSNERRLEVDADELAVFKRLPRPVPVLVLAEDWCGDVIDNLPILGRLAAESGKLDVRIFLRDQHPDLMDQYLNKGQFRSIPTYVFFDDQFKEIGRFIERPDSVTERRARLRRELFAQHPEFGSPDTPVDQLPEEIRVQIMQETTRQREELKPLENREVVRALREIVARVA
jgi:hypothetical protein